MIKKDIQKCCFWFVYVWERQRKRPRETERERKWLRELEKEKIPRRRHKKTENFKNNEIKNLTKTHLSCDRHYSLPQRESRSLSNLKKEIKISKNLLFCINLFAMLRVLNKMVSQWVIRKHKHQQLFYAHF